MLFQSSSFGRYAFTIVWLSFSGIHGHMVFFRLCRLPAVPGLFYIDFIRELLPASSAEDLLQLFFRKGMGMTSWEDP